MNKQKTALLADDIKRLSESLGSFESYDFVADIWRYMDKLGLSNNALAKRAAVSHTMVNKWLTQNARPHGKERMKELGMALGMNETELNEFLYSNCYPKLYIKSPLDTACKMLLRTAAGSDNIVKLYRDILELRKLKDYVLPSDRVEILTAELSQNFRFVSTKGFEAWLEQNDKHFGASAKAQIPNSAIVQFILLYLGQESIYKLYNVKLLPVAVKDLLYPLVSNKEIVLKGLRDKLIAFGLFMNMTEDEIDIMLSYTKLRPLSEPRTKLDCAVLTAVRCAHERYPYFEYSNMLRLTREITRLSGNSQTPRERSGLEELYNYYYNQLPNLQYRVEYYDKHRNEADMLFEDSYADHRIIRYMADTLILLNSERILAETETKEFLELIEAYEE